MPLHRSQSAFKAATTPQPPEFGNDVFTETSKTFPAVDMEYEIRYGASVSERFLRDAWPAAGGDENCSKPSLVNLTGPLAYSQPPSHSSLTNDSSRSENRQVINVEFSSRTEL